RRRRGARPAAADDHRELHPAGDLMRGVFVSWSDTRPARSVCSLPRLRGGGGEGAGSLESSRMRPPRPPPASGGGGPGAPGIASPTKREGGALSPLHYCRYPPLIAAAHQNGAWVENAICPRPASRSMRSISALVKRCSSLVQNRSNESVRM